MATRSRLQALSTNRLWMKATEEVSTNDGVALRVSS
jgi:hypothetical protein